MTGGLPEYSFADWALPAASSALPAALSADFAAAAALDAAALAVAGPVDVTAVIGRAEHMLKPLARAGESELTVELEEGLVVRADPDDLYQIFFNLMENAVKYNLPGGKVWVRGRAVGDKVEITVEDTGVGIPEADIDKVFDRFYRVDKARSRAAGGTGLGLSIVRELMARMGGRVSAQITGDILEIRLAFKHT